LRTLPSAIGPTSPHTNMNQDEIEGKNDWSREGWRKSNQGFAKQRGVARMCLGTYLYIYIYACVCVCVSRNSVLSL
jgi:hypothetical protein